MHDVICPYCAAAVTRWPEPLPLHECVRCKRPLCRLRTHLRTRRYAVLSLAGALHTLGSVVVLGSVASLSVEFLALKGFVLAVTLALVVYGLADVDDGVLSIVTRCDRTASRVREGLMAKRIGWLKLIFGLLTLGAAMIGLAVHRSMS